MSDIGNTLDENKELTTEEKKKAINLQDLVYIRTYINKLITAFENKTNTDNAAFKESVNKKYDDVSSDYDNFKTTTTQSIETKVQTEIQSSLNNITSGNTIVGNAKKVQGVNFAENTVSKVGDYIISKKKLVWSGNVELKVDPNLDSLYVNMVSIPADLVTALSTDGKYKLVGALTFSNGQIPDVDFKFECNFRMLSTTRYGENITPIGNQVMVIQSDSINLFTIPTKNGDVALFRLYGNIVKDTAGAYLSTPSSFELELISKASDKLNSSSVNSYAYKITELYKIID